MYLVSMSRFYNYVLYIHLQIYGASTKLADRKNGTELPTNVKIDLS